MTQATIKVTGIGSMSVNTEASEVTLVGAIAADGSYVNTTTKKVSRNKKSANEAIKNENENYPNHFLKQLDGDNFILIDLDEDQ